MGGGSAPAAPDYQAAAVAQGESSREVTDVQTAANRSNVYTPWGNQTWNSTASIDPATGKPVTRWSSNIELSPSQQAALNSQHAIGQGRSRAALDMLGGATSPFKQPLNFDGAPARSDNIDAFGMGKQFKNELSLNTDQRRQTAQDAVMKLQQPGLDARRGQLESQLANQGLSRGSEAYTNAMREQNDVETRAQLSAIDAGRTEANQMYQQDLGSSQFTNDSLGRETNAMVQGASFNATNRQQAIAEMLQKRGYSLNEMNALLSGQQVNTPQMPQYSQAGVAQGTQNVAAANSQYGAAMNQYNSDQASQQQTNQGLATAAGMAAMFMMSDLRLKEDIEEVGILASGVRMVEYTYAGLPGRYLGVIAQEVRELFPDAVAIHPTGYLMVDYSKVH